MRRCVRDFLRLKIMKTVANGVPRAREQYPEALSSYTCQLKLFFSCDDRENFFRVMQELKESDITIDNETLELIRIFM